MMGNPGGMGKTELVKVFCYEQNQGESSNPILWTDFSKANDVPSAERLIEETIDNLFPRPWIAASGFRSEYCCYSYISCE